VFLNLESRSARLRVAPEWGQARIVLSTALRSSPAPWGAELEANEGVIVEL
jgi:hypothetical protein